MHRWQPGAINESETSQLSERSESIWYAARYLSGQHQGVRSSVPAMGSESTVARLRLTYARGHLFFSLVSLRVQQATVCAKEWRHFDSLDMNLLAAALRSPRCRRGAHTAGQVRRA